MILSEAGAVFTAEMLCQDSRDGADQTVTLGKTMPPVKTLQACQVKEKDRRINLLFLHPFSAGFSQFVKMGHIGQAGHIIKIHALIQAFFRQKMVKGLIQDTLICSLIR